MVGHQVFRPSLERLINVKHVPLSRELKKRPVKTLQSAAQAVNVDHPCRGVRVRAEPDRRRTIRPANTRLSCTDLSNPARRSRKADLEEFGSGKKTGRILF